MPRPTPHGRGDHRPAPQRPAAAQRPTAKITRELLVKVASGPRFAREPPALLIGDVLDVGGHFFLLHDRSTRLAVVASDSNLISVIRSTPVSIDKSGPAMSEAGIGQIAGRI
jgi:hypothetical protein